MSASYDLFCRWKHVKKIGSDNAGALALDISRSTVSLWKQGKNAEIHLIERMAQDIGDSPEKWAAQVMAERASSEQEQGAWARIAKRLGAAAAVLLVAALPLSGKASIPGDFAITGDTAHYVKRLGYYWGVLRDWLAHRLQRPVPASGVLEARSCL